MPDRHRCSAGAGVGAGAGHSDSTHASHVAASIGKQHAWHAVHSLLEEQTAGAASCASVVPIAPQAAIAQHRPTIERITAARECKPAGKRASRELLARALPPAAEPSLGGPPPSRAFSFVESSLRLA